MVLFTTFEFIRKPWQGKELEVEKIASLQQHNLFESISSFSFDDANKYDEEVTVGWGNRIK